MITKNMVLCLALTIGCSRAVAAGNDEQEAAQKLIEACQEHLLSPGIARGLSEFAKGVEDYLADNVTKIREIMAKKGNAESIKFMNNIGVTPEFREACQEHLLAPEFEMGRSKFAEGVKAYLADNATKIRAIMAKKGNAESIKFMDDIIADMHIALETSKDATQEWVHLTAEQCKEQKAAALNRLKQRWLSIEKAYSSQKP